METEHEDNETYAVLASFELPLQANLVFPLKLKIDPVETADLLRRHLHLSPGAVITVEPRLLTDTTLDFLNLEKVHDHISSLAEGQRRQMIAARLHPPVEATAFLFFEILGVTDTTMPETLSETDCQAIMEGLVAQCPEVAKAPQMLEAPNYAAYALFDAQNAVRLHRLADETAAVLA